MLEIECDSRYIYIYKALGVYLEMTNEQNINSNKPYDDSMWDQWQLYDHSPYVCDRDLCGNRFTYESGNVIKSYRYVLKEPYELKYE